MGNTELVKKRELAVNPVNEALNRFLRVRERIIRDWEMNYGSSVRERARTVSEVRVLLQIVKTNKSFK